MYCSTYVLQDSSNRNTHRTYSIFEPLVSITTTLFCAQHFHPVVLGLHTPTRDLSRHPSQQRPAHEEEARALSSHLF